MDENSTPDVEQMAEATPPVDDTLSQQPALLDQVHDLEQEISTDEQEVHDLEHPVVLVCPVCGLTACSHNLPYTYAQR